MERASLSRMRYVLFVCTQNAGRSQMAQAFFERRGPPEVRTLACGAQCPYVPTTVEDWDVDDPSGRPLEEVRAIRDDIEERVIELARDRIDAIREDRRQHRMRMAQLVPGLVKEFSGTLTDEEIRRIADEILATYEEVPVRSFVLTLANRRAREILKARSATTV